MAEAACEPNGGDRQHNHLGLDGQRATQAKPAQWPAEQATQAAAVQSGHEHDTGSISMGGG
jgi:hypothetical protein